jgi:hypothetical protein
LAAISLLTVALVAPSARAAAYEFLFVEGEKTLITKKKRYPKKQPNKPGWGSFR